MSDQAPELTPPSSGKAKSRHRKRKQFSNYQVGDQIAQGTCGPVYLCLNADTGEFIVMKEYNLVASSSESAAKRMELLYHEINLLRKSRHANIVRYLGTEQRKDRFRVFMEFVPAGTLQKLLSQFGAFDEAVIKQYTRQMLSALAHMHSRNIVHGNVSTSHILVSSTGTVKLSGLGAAWRATPGCARTYQGDIWCLGAAMIEMATGTPPTLACPDPGYYCGEDGKTDDSSVTATGPPTVAHTLEDVKRCIPSSMSPELQAFVLLCMNPDPSQRPTAADLLDHPCMRTPEQRESTTPSSLPTPLVMTRLGHIGRPSLATYRARDRPPLHGSQSATHAYEGSRLRRVATERSEDPNASHEYQEEVWEALGRRPSPQTVPPLDTAALGGSSAEPTPRLSMAGESVGGQLSIGPPRPSTTLAGDGDGLDLDWFTKVDGAEKVSANGTNLLTERTEDVEASDDSSSSGAQSDTQGSGSDADESDSGEDQLGALGTVQFNRINRESRLSGFRFSHSSEDDGGGDSMHGGRTFSNTLLGIHANSGSESLGGGHSLAGSTFSGSLLGGVRLSTASGHRHPLHPLSKLRNLGRSDSMTSVASVIETDHDPLVTSGGWQMFDPLLDRNRLVGVVSKEQLMKKSGADKTGRTQAQRMFLSNIQTPTTPIVASPNDNDAFNTDGGVALTEDTNVIPEDHVNTSDSDDEAYDQGKSPKRGSGSANRLVNVEVGTLANQPSPTLSPTDQANRKKREVVDGVARVVPTSPDRSKSLLRADAVSTDDHVVNPSQQQQQRQEPLMLQPLSEPQSPQISPAKDSPTLAGITDQMSPVQFRHAPFSPTPKVPSAGSLSQESFASTAVRSVYVMESPLLPSLTPPNTTTMAHANMVTVDKQVSPPALTTSSLTSTSTTTVPTIQTVKALSTSMTTLPQQSAQGPSLFVSQFPPPGKSASAVKRSPFSSLKELLKGNRRRSDIENDNGVVSVQGKRSKQRGLTGRSHTQANMLPSTSPLTTSPVPAFEGACGSAVNDSSEYSSSEESVVEFGVGMLAGNRSTTGRVTPSDSTPPVVNTGANNGSGGGGTRMQSLKDAILNSLPWGSGGRRSQSLSAADAVPQQRRQAQHQQQPHQQQRQQGKDGGRNAAVKPPTGRYAARKPSVIAVVDEDTDSFDDEDVRRGSGGGGGIVPQLSSMTMVETADDASDDRSGSGNDGSGSARRLFGIRAKLPQISKVKAESQFFGPSFHRSNTDGNVGGGSGSGSDTGGGGMYLRGSASSPNVPGTIRSPVPGPTTTGTMQTPIGGSRAGKLVPKSLRELVPPELQSPVVVASGHHPGGFDSFQDDDEFQGDARMVFDSLEDMNDDGGGSRRHTVDVPQSLNTGTNTYVVGRPRKGSALHRLGDVKPRGLSEGNVYSLGIPDDLTRTITTPSSPTGNGHGTTSPYSLLAGGRTNGLSPSSPVITDKSPPNKVSPTIKLAPLVKPFL